MEKINANIKVFGNFIEITPLVGIKDNSIYDIKLEGLHELYGSKTLEPSVIRLVTELTPAYTTIQSVNSLIENCNIPEDKILYNIREASKYVDYIRDLEIVDKKNIPYEVEQYVRYKAAHDSLLSFYINKVSGAGVKGQLGEVAFENKDKFPDIAKLLKLLKDEIKRWEDALRGYKVEGRVKPRSAVKGINANPKLNGADLSFSRGL